MNAVYVWQTSRPGISSGSAENRSFRFINERGYDGDKHRQNPATASERGRPNKRRKVHEPTLEAAYGSQTSGPRMTYGGTHCDPSLDPNLGTS